MTAPAFLSVPPSSRYGKRGGDLSSLVTAVSHSHLSALTRAIPDRRVTGASGPYGSGWLKRGTRPGAAADGNPLGGHRLSAPAVERGCPAAGASLLGGGCVMANAFAHDTTPAELRALADHLETLPLEAATVGGGV